MIEYEVCACAFLTIIAIYVFGKKRFPSMQYRFFSAFVVIGIVDTLLDILTTYTITYAANVPEAVNQVLNIMFYIMQSLLMPMFFVYVLSLTGYLNDKKKRKNALLFLVPFFAVTALLITNPVTGGFFYFDEYLVYRHGPMYPLLMIVAGLYMLAATLLLIFKKQDVRAVEYYTMMVNGVMAVFVCVIQSVMPQYLLTGFAFSIVIVMMYMSLQNPEDMLDELTGLFNRSSFIYSVNHLYGTGKDFQLIIIDIDEMRPVNEIFGLTIGDMIICRIAQIIQNCSKDRRVFRILGDEFAVITDSKADCMTTVKHIKETIANPIMIGGMLFELSVCTCFSLNGGRCESADDLLPLAERSLARAKKQGKGAVMEVSDETITLLKRENMVEGLVRKAILNNSFEVYLQPIVCLKTGKIMQAEALARLYTDELGWIPPCEFIPIAERKGLIQRVSDTVLDTVCEFIVSNKLGEREDFKGISVNMSVVEFLYGNPAERIKNKLAKFGVTPDQIVLEITETTATLSDKLPEIMRVLNEIGVKFSLDDFGTGYANMDSVVRLPFSSIKIDRSMLTESNKNEKSRIVLENTINLSKRLGLKTVVEGAETQEHIDLIGQLGADYIQGFFYSKPLPIEQTLAFVNNFNLNSKDNQK
ncbi:MAG: EAL domain-containing protein [Oscillospiraceae bacterium]